MKFGLLEYLKLKVVCDSFQVLEKQKGIRCYKLKDGIGSISNRKVD
ncbi:hypothetical protein LEP1GSC075_3263 [Leptospira interrogans str. Kito]|uniref:Uncharacterized protein n=2 Tax=Leptospira interrogans TaxID=173 RepID=A0A0E2D0W6_LEPIR|nr:hypothetical protein LEP1GSC014_2102 [Leptospira interrogans serovar Pomona str. Pomona]EKO67761.1 hypothetical protein LEP1GSC069_1218 [Leptospira interrogans serovar Canicola str. Fiocruz LV133]EKO85389.1 hypothetical protein LEP1GSC009_1823 [Leptospira interrogans serovar Grippotyphosa str. Andaman]EKR26980.1 hypothetical protein LEP1GSC087_2702 [Leptospira interrogans serovar Bataviae str. L1111]EKR53228.1 hypothetical protein LEP1GSC105_1825 [Leptospira interrogans str. UI 12758]EMF322